MREDVDGLQGRGVSFRFLALSPMNVETLRQHCPEVVSRPSHGREGRLTGVFDLCEGRDHSWITDFIEQDKIAPSDYGLFVSIATSNDTEISTVPQFAADLYRRTGGVIDVSFTVLSDD